MGTSDLPRTFSCIYNNYVGSRVFKYTKTLWNSSPLKKINKYQTNSLMVAKNVKFNKNIFFGLQNCLKNNFGKITNCEHYSNWLDYQYFGGILNQTYIDRAPIDRFDVKLYVKVDPEVTKGGQRRTENIKSKISELGKLGYWPIKIDALPEGNAFKKNDVLISISSTLPDYYWAVDLAKFEISSIVLPTVMFSILDQYKQIIKKYHYDTVDTDNEQKINYTYDVTYDSDKSTCMTRDEDKYGDFMYLAQDLCFNNLSTVTALTYNVDYNYREKNRKIIKIPKIMHPSRADKYINEKILGLYGSPQCVHDFIKKCDIQNKLIILQIYYENIEQFIDQYANIFGYTYNKKGFKVLNNAVLLCWGFNTENFRETCTKFKNIFDKIIKEYSLSNFVIDFMPNPDRGDNLPIYDEYDCCGKINFNQDEERQKNAIDFEFVDVNYNDYHNIDKLVNVFDNGKIIETNYEDIVRRYESTSSNYLCNNNHN